MRHCISCFLCHILACAKVGKHQCCLKREAVIGLKDINYQSFVNAVGKMNCHKPPDCTTEPFQNTGESMNEIVFRDF